MTEDNITKFIILSFGIAIIASLIMGTVCAVRDYKAADTLWKEENECIASYISQEVERRDIVRDNGSCYVRGDY